MSQSDLNSESSEREFSSDAEPEGGSEFLETSSAQQDLADSAAGREHPSDESLLLFVAGRVDDSVAEEIEQHVLDCASCVQRMETLESQDDSFLANLRSVKAEGEDTAEFKTPRPAISAPELTIGSRLGEYIVKQRIGQGGMGIVYEAEHATMRRRVALKILPSQLNADKTYLERFQREVRAAGGLHHTNIVPVFDVGKDQGYHYFAMQFIPGQSLDRVLLDLRDLDRDSKSSTSVENSLRENIAGNLISGEFQPKSSEAIYTGDTTEDDLGILAEIDIASSGERGQEREERRLETLQNVESSTAEFSDSSTTHNNYFRRVARIGRQIADALSYAHQHGILHRDIKPANILLDPEGTAWITDFGLAKSEDDNITLSGDIVGTLRYMAPERFSGTTDARSDLYGLGLTLYELSTLKSAFESTTRAGLIHEILHQEPPSPRRIKKGIPRDLETIILKTISKQPQHRYQTARQLQTDLRLFLEDRPIRARRTPPWERFWRWCRRNPQQAILSGCVAFLLTFLLIGSMIYSYRTQQDANLLEKENRRALGAESQALKAKRLATDNSDLANSRLYRQLRTLAELAPSTRRPGQRFHSVDSLKQAVNLLPQLDLKGEGIEEHLYELRNEAIAVFSLFDIEEVTRKQAESPWLECLSFNSKHDKYVLTDEDGNLVVRLTEDDRIVSELPGPMDRAWRATFSPDDRYLAATYYVDNLPTVFIWDIVEREQVFQLPRGPARERALFTRDSRHLVVCFRNGVVRFFNLSNGEVDKEFQIEGEPTSFCLSPANDQVAITARNSSIVTIWNVADNMSRQVDLKIIPFEIAWSANGNLAVGTRNGDIHIWKSSSDGSEFEVLKGHQAFQTRLSFSEKGDVLASSSVDGTVRFWNTVIGENLLRIDDVRMIDSDFSLGEQKLAFRNDEREFGYWRVPDDIPFTIGSNPAMTRWRWDVEFFADDNQTFVASTDDGLEVWSAETGRLVETLRIGPTFRTVFTPDHQTMITCGRLGLQKWPINRDVDNEGQVTIGPPIILSERSNKSVERSSNYAAIDSTGTSIASIRGYDHAIFLDMDNPTEVKRLVEHESVYQVALSKGGKWLVTSTWQGKGIRVWDTETGKLVRDLDMESRGATVVFSPDGQFLATSNWREICLWEIPSGKKVFQIPKSPVGPWPNPLAFSSDGKILAAPYSQRLTQLIDVASGTTMAILRSSHPGSLNQACCFSPDSRKFVQTADDQVHMWDLSQIRTQLTDVGLEWNEVPAENKSDSGTSEPLHIELLLEEPVAAP